MSAPFPDVETHAKGPFRFTFSRVLTFPARLKSLHFWLILGAIWRGNSFSVFCFAPGHTVTQRTPLFRKGSTPPPGLGGPTPPSPVLIANCALGLYPTTLPPVGGSKVWPDFWPTAKRRPIFFPPKVGQKLSKSGVFDDIFLAKSRQNCQFFFYLEALEGKCFTILAGGSWEFLGNSADSNSGPVYQKPTPRSEDGDCPSLDIGGWRGVSPPSSSGSQPALQRAPRGTYAAPAAVRETRGGHVAVCHGGQVPTPPFGFGHGPGGLPGATAVLAAQTTTQPGAWYWRSRPS